MGRIKRYIKVVLARMMVNRAIQRNRNAALDKLVEEAPSFLPLVKDYKKELKNEKA